MQVDLALLADYAAVTQENKFVVAGIFDAILSGEIPITHPHMALALQVRIVAGEDTAHRVKVSLVDADGNDVIPPLEASVSGDRSVADKDATFKLVLNLDNVNFQAEGSYSFHIFLDGRFEHRVPLQVRKAPQSREP